MCIFKKVGNKKISIKSCSACIPILVRINLFIIWINEYVIFFTCIIDDFIGKQRKENENMSREMTFKHYIWTMVK